MKLIHNDISKCKMCYACIKVCPSKAIKVEKNHINIIAERCVACGSCVSSCAPGALTYYSSKDKVKSLLRSDNKVVAIVAPTISGEFYDISDYRRFVGMIRALGFDYVNEISFGVDLISKQYKKLFENFHGKYYISSNCPVTTTYIKKIFPDLIDNLAPIVPPFVATAMVVKEIYGKDVKVVYIGSCLAAKEKGSYTSDINIIDEVLTFVELRELFDEFEIKEHIVEYSEFDTPLGGKGSLYPVPRGFLQATNLNEDLLTSNILTTQGKDNFLKVIREFHNSTELQQHVNVFFCDGCIMGPGTSPGGEKFLRRARVIHYTQRRMQNFDHDKWQSEIEKYESLDFSTRFGIDDQRYAKVTKENIEKTLILLGRIDNNILNCGACGYNTCENFAEAINLGLARNEMCAPYTISQMKNYIRKLDSANEKLKNTEKALIESERKIREEHELAKNASSTISAMLQKIPTGVVIVDKDLKIVESNRYFIEFLGAEAKELDDVVPGLVGADLRTLVPFHKIFSNVLISGEDILNRDMNFGNDLYNISVFTIQKNKTVGGIIRDMTVPEVRKNEVIGRAKEVIRENLETVQQIAFLLGESASKTERILNSIIRSHSSGKTD